MTKKFWNVFGIVWLCLCAVLLILFLGFVIALGVSWLDVSGLHLYRRQPIRELYTYEGCAFVVTEDGSGYIGGKFALSSNLKYQNAESYPSAKLGAAAVRFYDGKDDGILQIVPTGALSALFITESKKLYRVFDLHVDALYDGICAVDLAADGTVYAVTEQKALLRLDISDPEEVTATVLLDRAIQQVCCGAGQTLYVLGTDGCLYEATASSDAQRYVLSEPLFEGVREVDSVYTDPDGEQVILNVLLTDGSLYSRGVHHAGDGTNGGAAPTFGSADAWTLLRDDVAAFALSCTGTLMQLEDGRGGMYMGLDTEDGTGCEAQTKVLDVSGIGFVYAGQSSFVVGTEDALYAWGSPSDLIFDYEREGKYNILSGVPHVIR